LDPKSADCPGRIPTLTDRPITMPDQQKFRPAQDNLTRHRRNIFR